MKIWKFCLTALLATGLLVVGCGDTDGAEGDSAGDVLFETSDASTEECPEGGTVVTLGTDEDGDGSLSDDEIDETVVICDGRDGTDGEDGEDGAEGPQGPEGEAGQDGEDGEDAECYDREDLSIDIGLESVSHFRTGETYTLEVITSATADDLRLVATGEATLDNLTDTADGVEADLTFTSTQSGSLVVIGTDGCTVDTDQLTGPVYPPSYQTLEAGVLHNCGLRTDGSVSCWGPNPVTKSSESLTSHVTPPEDDDFEAISASSYGNCGLHADQTVSCWGYASFFGNMPSMEAPDGEFEQIDAGSQFVCGITVDETVRCFEQEENEEFEFDTDDVLDDPSGESIEDVLVTDLWNQLVVRLDNEDVYNVSYETEDDNGDVVFEFEAEPFLDDDPDEVFLQLDAGREAICGTNGLDQGVCHLPLGKYERTSTNDVKKTVAGAWHGCSLFEDGSITCLGPGADNEETAWYDLDRDETELDAPADKEFTKLTTGATHSCGITDEDLVRCWGEAHGRHDRIHYPSVTEPIQ